MSREWWYGTLCSSCRPMWKQKITFTVDTLKVSYALFDTFQYEANKETFVRDNHNCKNYILNSLSDELYDVFAPYERVNDIQSAFG